MKTLYAEDEEKDKKVEAEDPDKLDLTDKQKEWMEEKEDSKKSKKSRKSKRAEDEEDRHEREMSKAEDEDKEKEDADDDEDDKKDASLRGQVRALKSELRALKAKVKSAEVDPLIDQILEAKSQLGEHGRGDVNGVRDKISEIKDELMKERLDSLVKLKNEVYNLKEINEKQDKQLFQAIEELKLLKTEIQILNREK